MPLFLESLQGIGVTGQRRALTATAFFYPLGSVHELPRRGLLGNCLMPGMGDAAATALEEALSYESTAANSPRQDYRGALLLLHFAGFLGARSAGLEPATF